MQNRGQVFDKIFGLLYGWNNCEKYRTVTIPVCVLYLFMQKRNTIILSPRKIQRTFQDIESESVPMRMSF